MPHESEKKLLPPLAPTWAVITCTRRQTKQEIAMKIPKIISHHERLAMARRNKTLISSGGLSPLP
jgi:hypothetical protein